MVQDTLGRPERSVEQVMLTRLRQDLVHICDRAERGVRSTEYSSAYVATFCEEIRAIARKALLDSAHLDPDEGAK